MQKNISIYNNVSHDHWLQILRQNVKLTARTIKLNIFKYQLRKNAYTTIIDKTTTQLTKHSNPDNMTKWQ